MTTLIIVILALFLYSILFLVIGYPSHIKHKKRLIRYQDLCKKFQKLSSKLITENNEQLKQINFWHTQARDLETNLVELRRRIHSLESGVPEMMNFQRRISMADNYSPSHGEVTTRCIQSIRDMLREAGKNIVDDCAEIRIIQSSADRTLKQFSVLLTIPKTPKHNYEGTFPDQKGPKFSKKDLYNHSKQAEVAWNIVSGQTV